MPNIESKTNELLSLLMQSEHCISIAEIQNELGISRRTVYYLVNKLNDYFYSSGIDPVNNKRGSGYYLSEEQKKKVSIVLENECSLDMMKSADRVYYLICWLLYPKHVVRVDDIMKLFGISRNSVFSDLKKVKEELDKHNLILESDPKEGYIIRGSIVNNHAVLMYYLESLLRHYHYQDLHFLNVSEVEIFYKRLLKISSELGNEYKDESLLVISCLLSIVHHTYEKFDFSLLELKDLGSTRELQLIDRCFQDFNVHERLYLAVYLLGSKAGKALRLHENENDIQLFELSQMLVEQFERISCLTLEDKSDLINSLYLHFKLSLYYHSLSIQTMNSLIDDVESNYKDLYELVKSLCYELEDYFLFPLTESEIVYITIHFGGHIKNGFTKLYRQIKVLVVCPSGISTSTLLKREIENLYANVKVVASVSADEIHEYEDVDFIVSTIDVQSTIPWIKVHSILSKEDKTRIASMMALNYVTYQADEKGLDGFFNIVSKYVSKENMNSLKQDVYQYIQGGNSFVEINERSSYRIFEILNKVDILVVNENLTWREAIRTASQPLLERNVIRREYVDSMIQLVEDYGPYIVLQNGVAIAHSKSTDGANLLGLSLLVNKTKILFDGNTEVQFLFVLSNPDQDKHLHLLRDIMEFSKQKDILNKILIASSSSLIIDYIKESLK